MHRSPSWAKKWLSKPLRWYNQGATIKIMLYEVENLGGRDRKNPFHAKENGYLGFFVVATCHRSI
jgi:hypothetical protein